MAITITLSLPCIAEEQAVTVISAVQEANTEQDNAEWTPEQLMQSLLKNPEVRQADKDNPLRYSYAVGYARKYQDPKYKDFFLDPKYKKILDNWTYWAQSFTSPKMNLITHKKHYRFEKRLKKHENLGASHADKNKKYSHKTYKRE